MIIFREARGAGRRNGTATHREMISLFPPVAMISPYSCPTVSLHPVDAAKGVHYGQVWQERTAIGQAGDA